jgi:hypothetical protein
VVSVQQDEAQVVAFAVRAVHASDERTIVHPELSLENRLPSPQSVNECCSYLQAS